MATPDLTLVTESTLSAKIDAITKYGGLPNRVTELEQAKVYVDHSVGTRVFGWDETNQKLHMIAGDTKWRDIKALLPAGVAAVGAWARRIDSTIYLNFQGLSTTTGGLTTIWSPPTYWRPDGPSIRAGVIATQNTNVVRIVSPFAGNIRVLDMPPNVGFEGSIAYTTTEAWPATDLGLQA